MITKKTPVRKPAKKPSSPVVPTPPAAPIVAQAKPEPENKDLLRKRELVERVALRAGVKKKDVKPIMEVMLAEMGEALAAGRPCALPPLGRIAINREKELPDGRVVILKLRQKTRHSLKNPDLYLSGVDDA